jgi:hypothetical protein
LLIFFLLYFVSIFLSSLFEMCKKKANKHYTNNVKHMSNNFRLIRKKKLAMETNWWGFKTNNKLVSFFFLHFKFIKWEFQVLFFCCVVNGDERWLQKLDTTNKINFKNQLFTLHSTIHLLVVLVVVCSFHLNNFKQQISKTKEPRLSFKSNKFCQ